MSTPQNAPIAFVELGSDDPILFPAGNNVVDYRAWAMGVGPRLKRCGIARICLHNPGGQTKLAKEPGDPRSMRCDQWEIAERARLPFADRTAFRDAVGILRYYGATEVIVYVGSPTQLLDPVRELPQVLEAFTACGPIVSLGFDAMFEDGIASHTKPSRWQDLWALGSPYRAALSCLRTRHKVYAEARLHSGQLAAGLGKLVDGTIADARFDARTQYDLSKQPGETIRLNDPVKEAQWKAAPWWPETNGWSATVTRALRSDLNWGPLLDAYSHPADFVERNKR